MAFERREFAGAAANTTLSGGINAVVSSFTITDATNWPDGGDGDFFVVIDPGTSTEEKVRCAGRTTTTVSVASGGRGADGTTAAIHNTGAVVRVCITAVDLDESNAHIADDALDHHSQYLNTTRHDVEARHTFGAALGTPATPSSVGTANATGSGNNPAREDHVHVIGTGAINSTGMFSAPVLATLTASADAAGGFIDEAYDGSDQNSITTEVDLTGMTITFTAGTSRRYKITAVVEVEGNGTTTSAYIRLKTGATLVRERFVAVQGPSGRPASTSLVVTVTPSAGSITYKLTGAAASADFNCTDRYLLIEDIGAA